MTIKVGEKIPSATFKFMGPDGPTDISSDELCAGKTVFLFGVPGAFTPVCSAQHLPGFIDKASELEAKGVNSIACVSANDPFVMQAWGEACNADNKVAMLTDSGGVFTRAIGLELDLSDFGLGERSRRYSMIAKDSLVTAIEVEDSIFNCEVSSANAMLAQI